ncbi:MAG: hypothetical protein Tsb0016_22820 [Sphingomonadales bacterium]
MTAWKLRFDPNPDYGSGAFRRRIRLINRPGATIAALDDSHHAMQCVLYHDGAQVTDIDARMLRVPTTACPGAAVAIRELTGWRLDTPMTALYGDGRPRRHCTHLFDLAVLAMAQARRTTPQRVYEAVVPDETTAPVVAEVWRDGACVLAWQVSQGEIVTPAAWRGKPLVAGFAGWALTALDGEALEAALVLHKAYFVSRGRRYLVNRAAGQPIGRNERMIGACFAYAPGQVETARFIGDHVRDYSEAIVETPLPTLRPEKEQQ